MAFRTKIDFSNNRQVRQHIETLTSLSGGTAFGVPFNQLPTGPDPLTSGETENYLFFETNFTTNLGVTTYSWPYPDMVLGESSLSAWTISNSGETQDVPTIWVPSSTTIIDNNTVALTYMGIEYDVSVVEIIDLGGGSYSGRVETDSYTKYSAGTIDFTGRTIWVDVSGITRTQDLIIGGNGNIGDVWTKLNNEGKGYWSPSSGGGTGSTPTIDVWVLGTGTNSAVLKNSSSLASGDFSVSEGDSNISSGFYSHSSGYGNTSSGIGSATIGTLSVASGNYSYAGGIKSYAFSGASFSFGDSSTSEGYASTSFNSSKAKGKYSFSCGRSTVANGDNSHAQGHQTYAGGNGSHAEGATTQAIGEFSHAEGSGTYAGGIGSHTEGGGTEANGIFSHAEGSDTKANGDYSHAEGSDSYSTAASSHAEGVSTRANGIGSHSEGFTSVAAGNYSHAEGVNSGAIGIGSHSEGNNTRGYGDASHAEGTNTFASGTSSHAEGFNTNAYGNYSHAEGQGSTTYKNASHAEGFATVASGASSHAEGHLSVAGGDFSHAQGFGSIASGVSTHAEGHQTQAIGNYSHSQNYRNKTIGANSSAGGSNSTANGLNSFVHGDTSEANGSDTIVLGKNITGTTANTTYVDYLNIKRVGATASINDIRIDNNGNLTTNTSDFRLKENITPLIGSLDKIKALSGVSFNWKDRSAGGDIKKLGFIAQDVESVEPLLVFTNTNDENNYKGIHIDGVIPLLVEAIKELSSGITSSTNTFLETQTVRAEDNNIELNFNGNPITATGGGFKVLHGMGVDLASELSIDSKGEWITNNRFKPKNLMIQEFTPTSTTDNSGEIGDITRDSNYIYIRTTDGWKRSNLETF